MTKTMVLQDSYKQYSYDLDKVCAPEETVARVRYRFQKLNLDLLKNTLRIDSGRLDIPVYVSLCGVDAVRTIGTQKQMGKGSTPAQAEASALMELVERFSFFSFMQRAAFLYATPGSLVEESVPFKTLARSLFDAGDTVKPRPGGLPGLAPALYPCRQPDLRSPAAAAHPLVLPDQ